MERTTTNWAHLQGHASGGRGSLCKERRREVAGTALRWLGEGREMAVSDKATPTLREPGSVKCEHAPSETRVRESIAALQIRVTFISSSFELE